ncbi:MAG: tRNA preQ1(34) S-adenosylmethionine ribosyltransferase-isomerase QueA [Candidatus Brocadia sp. WS118]|nr:MAG: tRNA preQ1(34) S-adenosylmethionine ribosyltransferase-isomerase QueA [Candidatus Brocadia sp. WS118]
MDSTASKPLNFYPKLSGYDYDLPKELIAQQPLENREDARLLILYRSTGRIEHRKFYEITEYLCPGDFLVLNNTKVIPALLPGKRISGASLELLLTEERKENQWKVLIKSNAKLKIGEEIHIGDSDLSAKILRKDEDGSWLIQFDKNCHIKDMLVRFGKMPLPPYIKRTENNSSLCSSDKERYQTVFAQNEGAIAAPTAGLHFSQHILEKIKKHGVEIGFVTLHVGMGTFLPIKTDDIQKHQMQKEYYECPGKIMEKIKETKEHQHRVIAVGSTSCRVLESVAMNTITPQTSGWTNLFIYPPYHFQYVDVLLTNFHLPKTTLLVLVCAFAGKENILNAYEIAKKEGYRFFSYGDCMMIV